MDILNKCPKCQGNPTICDPVHIGGNIWSCQVWCNDCDWVSYGDEKTAKAAERNAKMNWNKKNGLHMKEWLAKTESK